MNFLILTIYGATVMVANCNCAYENNTIVRKRRFYKTYAAEQYPYLV